MKYVPFVSQRVKTLEVKCIPLPRLPNCKPCGFGKNAFPKSVPQTALHCFRQVWPCLLQVNHSLTCSQNRIQDDVQGLISVLRFLTIYW